MLGVPFFFCQRDQNQWFSRQLMLWRIHTPKHGGCCWIKKRQKLQSNMVLLSVISTWIYTWQRINPFCMFRKRMPLHLQVEDNPTILFPREFIHKWINFFPECLAVSPQMKKVKMWVVSKMTPSSRQSLFPRVYTEHATPNIAWYIKGKCLINAQSIKNAREMVWV